MNAKFWPDNVKGKITWKRRLRWEDIIKMDFNKIGSENVDWIQDKIQ